MGSVLINQRDLVVHVLQLVELLVDGVHRALPTTLQVSGAARSAHVEAGAVLGRPSGHPARAEAIAARLLDLGRDMPVLLRLVLVVVRDVILHPDQLICLLIPALLTLAHRDRSRAIVRRTVRLRQLGRALPTGRHGTAHALGLAGDAAGLLEEDLLAEVADRVAYLLLLGRRAALGCLAVARRLLRHDLGGEVAVLEERVAWLLAVQHRLVHRGVELGARHELVCRGQAVVGLIEQVDDPRVGVLSGEWVQQDLRLVLHLVLRRHRLGELHGGVELSDQLLVLLLVVLHLGRVQAGASRVVAALL